MKTTLLILVGMVGVLLLGFLLWTMSLPKERQGQATQLVNAPAAVVMATLLDVQGQPRWRPDVQRIEILAGDQWIEHKADGDTIQFTRTLQTERELHLKFSSPRGYSGQWLGNVESQGNASRIAVTESVSTSAWLPRVLGVIFFDPEKFARQYLERLAQEAQRRATNTPTPS